MHNLKTKLKNVCPLSIIFDIVYSFIFSSLSIYSVFSFSFSWFIEDFMKKNKSKMAQLESLKADLVAAAKKGGFSLDQKTKAMKARDKKVNCKLFHGAGLVVPVDENDVGYREVPETPGELTVGHLMMITCITVNIIRVSQVGVICVYAYLC